MMIRFPDLLIRGRHLLQGGVYFDLSMKQCGAYYRKYGRRNIHLSS